MNRSPRFARWWWLACPGLWSCGDSQLSTESGSRPSLLLITLDTTRFEVLDSPELAPRLHEWSQEALVCAAAHSVTPLTLPSHTSMMTGLYPFAHGVRDNDIYTLPGDLPTLAEVLREAGYRAEAVVASTVLRSSTGLDRGFEHYDDLSLHRAGTFTLEAERDGAEVTDVASARLVVDDPRPFFLWVHYFDPHFPYRPAGYEGPGGREGYEAEIRYLDRQIGLLLDRLEEAGLDQETAVLVVGDHGEGLGMQQELTHGFLCEQSTLRVPMALRWPGMVSPGTLKALTSSVDVYPTLLACAGVLSPFPTHGMDVVAAQRRAADSELEDRAVYFESYRGFHVMRWSPLSGVVMKDWKYVRNRQEELFALSPSWQEDRNLAAQQPQVLRAARNRLQQILDEPVASFEPEAMEIDPAERARLSELGYLASVEPTDWDVNRSDLLDPREHYTTMYAAYQRSQNLSAAGRHEEAVDLMQELVQKFPDNPSFHDRLGRTLLAAGRFDDAIEAFTRSLSLDDSSITSWFGRAQARWKRGAWEDAEQDLRQTVQRFPEHLDAWRSLRLLAQQTQRKAEQLVATAHLLSITAQFPGPAIEQMRATLSGEFEQLAGELKVSNPEIVAQARHVRGGSIRSP